MWYTWTTLLLVSCTLVRADVGAGAEAAGPLTTGAPLQAQLQPQADVTKAPVKEPAIQIEYTTTRHLDQEASAEKVAVATTRAPPLTLDRKAGELAWRSWLQSPESGNQNAPPRRIITKSLFITPLVCPKGQRLDRNGCVQVVTVNKDEHERILLEQLNALFPSASNGDVLYDYGDDEPGPLQLSIPIGLDPQAAPLHSQEPPAQAQGQQTNFVDKKDTIPNSDASIEAELEILKLQHSHNDSTTAGNSNVLNHNIVSNLLNLADKPKRDSPVVNATETDSHSTSEEGQKEMVFGHVNVDPILYSSGNENHQVPDVETKPSNASSTPSDTLYSPVDLNTTTTHSSNSSKENLNKNSDKTKLNPENDYSDIGEAIKLISRYAEVTTDDSFAKNQKKNAMKEDSILGTRTKLQYQRNRPKPDFLRDSMESHMPHESLYRDKMPIRSPYIKNEPYYRYPWPGQHSATPPPDYPFRHLQDYWPGRTQIGGVYNTHENPRRHHHSYPHYFRPRSYTGNSDVYSGQPEPYPEQSQIYNHRLAQRHINPSRSHTNNQELYSLLGLRHWFSSEGTSKR